MRSGDEPKIELVHSHIINVGRNGGNVVFWVPVGFLFVPDIMLNAVLGIRSVLEASLECPGCVPSCW